MEKNSTKQGQKSIDEKEMCPMSAMCKGMMEKPGSRFLLMIPGAVLVIVGVLILIKPTVLFWLMACTSILIGIIMLVLANFIKKMGARFENVQD
jgi:uncharacterized membrane protein HdeD (DUF308 family)